MIVFPEVGFDFAKTVDLCEGVEKGLLPEAVLIVI